MRTEIVNTERLKVVIGNGTEGYAMDSWLKQNPEVKKHMSFYSVEGRELFKNEIPKIKTENKPKEVKPKEVKPSVKSEISKTEREEIKKELDALGISYGANQRSEYLKKLLEKSKKEKISEPEKQEITSLDFMEEPKKEITTLKAKEFLTNFIKSAKDMPKAKNKVLSCIESFGVKTLPEIPVEKLPALLEKVGVDA